MTIGTSVRHHFRSMPRVCPTWAAVGVAVGCLVVMVASCSRSPLPVTVPPTPQATATAPAPRPSTPLVTRIDARTLAIHARGETLQQVVNAVAAEMVVAIRLSPELATLPVALTIGRATVEGALKELLIAARIADYVWVNQRVPDVAGAEAWVSVRRVRASGSPAPVISGAAPSPAPSADDIAPREVMVRFAAGLSEADIAREITRLRAEVLRVLPALRLYRLRIPANQSVSDFLSAQQGNPAIQRVEANPRVRVFQAASQLPNDPYFESQWGLRRMGVPGAWAVSTGRPEVVIAIIDTGVDLAHPDLQAQLVAGHNVLAPDTPPQDDHGHGTAMAGIVGAAMNNGVGIAGVCPGCRIMPIKALDANGVGSYADVMEGIVYAADHGARVVNLSVGGSVYSDALRDAVDYARNAGAVVVAAAGNAGTDAPVYPAAYPGVLGVAAVDRDDTVWPSSNRGPHVSLAAPGVDITTTGLGGDYISVTGTSPATAHVAGVAGLMVAREFSTSAERIESVLVQSTVDIGLPGRDDISGFGLLDVAAALRQDSTQTHRVSVTRLQFGSASFAAGQAVPITVTIQNDGIVAERNLVVTLKANGVDIGAWLTIESIAAGESRTVTFTWIPPVGLTQLTLAAAVSGTTVTGAPLTASAARHMSFVEANGVVSAQYKDRSHGWIVNEAALLMPAGSPRSEILAFLVGGTPEMCSAGASSGTGIREGAIEEDDGADGSPKCAFRENRYEHHFWRPNYGYDDALACIGVCDLDGILNTSAVARAEGLWQLAKAAYMEDNKSLAYWYLGRVAHLLSDMALPAHVHNDPHPTDKYESWMEDNYYNYTGTGYPTNYRTLNMLSVGNWTDAPHQVRPGTSEAGQNYSSTLTDAQRSSLFKLFLDMAEIGDDYESDDYDGELFSHYGYLLEQDCDIHARTLVPAAIRHVAGLYELFWEETHPVAFISSRPTGPVTVAAGVPFTVSVTASNYGAADGWGGLSMSFSELTAPSSGSDCGTSASYSAADASVTVQSSAFSQVKFYRTGCSLQGASGPAAAQYLLVEASNTPFGAAPATRSLSLQVTPKKPMQLLVRIREALCLDLTCELPVSRDPQAETTAPLDQQGFRAYEYVVNVTGLGMTVTSIVPSNGSTLGGTPVTITGAGFEAGAAVTIGGVAATSVVVVNATTITAVTGAHAAGAVDVVVTNPGAGPATLAGAFTYATPGVTPTITSLVPTTLTTAPCSVRQLLTIIGTGFTSSTTLVFNASDGEHLSVATHLRLISQTKIEYDIAVCTEPDTWTVKAVTGVLASAPATFNVVAAASPTITTSSPLPTGTVGSVYSQTLQATGGATPYGWAAVSGGLPTGLILDGGTGAITGTPTVASTFSFRARATGGNGLSAEKDYSLTINPSPTGPTIRVSIVPQGAADAGAQWKLATETGWHNSGNIVSVPSLGTYQIQFKTVSGWTTPPDRTVTLSPSQTEIWIDSDLYVQQPVLPLTERFSGIEFGDNQFVVVGGAMTIVTTPDGVNWVRRAGLGDLYPEAVSYANGLYVVVGRYNAGRIMTSPNGTDWTSRFTDTSVGTLHAVTFGQGLHVAVGGKVVTSPDGVNWAVRDVPRYGSAELFGIAYGNNTFVATTEGGWVLTSTDGVTWNLVTPPDATSFLGGVAFGNNLFVTVGWAGKILTSPDGTHWVMRESSTQDLLSGVSYANDTFVVVGDNGRLVTSTDGINWTSRNAGTAQHLRSVAFGNNTFVGAGHAGTLIPLGNTFQSLITVQPLSQTRSVGEDVTLTVAATGAGPITYQWRLDGADISGETSASLSLGGVTPSQTGSYSAVVQNPSMRQVSQTAVLTVVTKATPVITWPNPASIVYGTVLSETQLNATASFGGAAVDGTFAYDPPVDTVLNVGAGQTLSATFTPTDAATYTTATAAVTIDVTASTTSQFVQQGPKLVGTGAVGSLYCGLAQQGRAVSISGDGNTAIVGGFGDECSTGAAWVWTRSGGVWAQQGDKLVGSDAAGAARQGSSVSLSADGNTAIVGGEADNGTLGAAWIWTRSGGVWTQQGPKLVGSGAVGAALQGTSVSLSADGNTAIVGGAYDNGTVGAAWIWTRSGGVWTQEGTKLVGSGAVGIVSYQGMSVALSADGNTAIVGGPGDGDYTSYGGNKGAAWVWTRSGGVWTQQGTKLVGSGAVLGSAQGTSVSLSADGSTAIVGGWPDNEDVGAAWVWTRNGGVWTQQGAKLVGSGAAYQARQGRSVSLSADGNTAVVGGPNDNGTAGAAWIWKRNGGIWLPHGTKLVGSDASNAFQGHSVSLSADGNTAIMGGFNDNGGAGAAWVFTASSAAGVAPAFTAQPSNQAVAVGGDATFTVAASGTPTPALQWQMSADGGATFTDLMNAGPCSGVTTETLTVSGVTSSFQGRQFRCVAANIVDSATSDVATLTVAQAAATVTLGSLSQTYDGTPRAATATTTPTGLTVTFSYVGTDGTTYGPSPSAPANAGTYTVTATINDANHTHSVTGTLTVAKGTATVTFGALSQTYDGTPRAATAATIPTGLTVMFSYVGTDGTTFGPSATAPTNVGTYSVTGAVDSPNYGGSATGTLTVVRPAPTVTGTSPVGGLTAGGTLTAVAGSGFVDGAGVTFDGVAATNVVVVNATTITATTPPHPPGAVDVVVTNPDAQSATLANAFTYAAPAPTLSGMTPSGGPLGTVVTLTGTGFTGATAASFNGVTAAYAVASDTQITATVPAGTTTGPVRVSTSGGTVTSAADFAVTNQWATRTLPSCYVPGYALTVTVDVGPAPGVSAQALEDAPPATWTRGAVSHDGEWDPTTSQLKWGPFEDATPRTITYELTPPADATAAVTFAGVVRFDGVDVPVGGATTLARCEAHPADTNGDWRLVISEVTGYGAAWKKGNTWSTPPVPIPIGYVTRAGYLWRAGETYRRDDVAGACPLCWLPLAAEPLPLSDVLLLLDEIPTPRSGPWNPE